MGVDKSVLIDSDDVEEGDQFLTATILVVYLKDKKTDIILAGNIAVDNGTGQVIPRLAEELGISAATTITKLIVDGETTTIGAPC